MGGFDIEGNASQAFEVLFEDAFGVKFSDLFASHEEAKTGEDEEPPKRRGGNRGGARTQKAGDGLEQQGRQRKGVDGQ